MNGPRIYLIGRPTVAEDEIERFLADRGLDWSRTNEAASAEELVEFGGRVCYLSFRGDTSSIRFPNSLYIANLIEKGHESVLEHATWTLLVDKVSRSFSHQLVRHRIGFSFSQLSQQYHDEADAEFVIPDQLRDEPRLRDLWQTSVQSAREAYRKLLAELTKEASTSDKEALRRIRSTARSLLPNATETTIVVTANARALRHFLETRGAVVGDLEMRQVAYGIFNAVCHDSPALFADFEAGMSIEDGAPIVQPRERPEKVALA